MTRKAVVGFAILIALYGAAGFILIDKHNRELSALTARVDSFATTLTSVTERLGTRRAETAAATSLGGGVASIGAETAPVVILAFEDFECPYCAKYELSVFDQLREKYIATGTVQYITKDFPLPFHKNSMRAAVAARCAARQDKQKYWDYRRTLFQMSKSLDQLPFSGTVSRLGLNVDALRACMTDSTVVSAIRVNTDEAKRIGVNGTPAFVVGLREGMNVKGILINGMLEFEEFQKVIAKVVERSKTHTGQEKT